MNGENEASELTGLEGIARIKPLLKLAYSFHSTDPSRMRACIDEAFQLADANDSDEFRSKCFNMYSIYHGVAGNYHLSLDYAFKSLNISGDSSDPDELASGYTNISIIYGRLSEHDNARKYAELALEQSAMGLNRQRTALILNNLGVACEKTGDVPRALECFLDAADILEETGPPDQYSLVLVNAGQQHKTLGNSQAAEEYLRKALALAEENGADYAHAAAVLDLAVMYTERKRDSFEIRNLLEKALETAIKLDDKDFLSRTYSTMSDCYGKLGDYAGALEAYKEYAALREEVLGSEKIMAIARLEKEFQFQQKEKEAEIYRLRNVELVKARDAAESADRAKSDFLAMMSHEIRTPLNVIMGMLEIVLRSGLDVEQREYLEKCSFASRSLLQVINDILDYSRIEAGRIEFENICFDPALVVGETASIFETAAKEKLIDLVVETDDSLPALVKGDPGRLGQVLRNLLSNAIKFTGKGNVTVTADCSCPGGESVELRFRVSDTGPGISRELAAELFKPFVQASSSTSRTHGGSGLGLVISRRLIEGIGGTIELESSPGSGSVFTVRAPFERVSDPSMDDDCELCPSGGIKSSTVMVVEDMDSGREIARLFLEMLGANVVEAENGYRALELLSQCVPDLVLMDLQMPGIDGIETTKRIRDMGISIPVIAATAHAMVSQKQICIDTGMNDVLTKPFSIEDLKRVLSRWLE